MGNPRSSFRVADIVIRIRRAAIVTAPDSYAIVISTTLRRIVPHEVDGLDSIGSTNTREPAGTTLVHRHGIAVGVVVVGGVETRC